MHVNYIHTTPAHELFFSFFCLFWHIHIGFLPVSVRVPKIHIQPIRCQRDGSHHALQPSLMPGKGPLHPEELQLPNLPSPKLQSIPYISVGREVCGSRSAICAGSQYLGCKLHLSVLCWVELQAEASVSNFNQSHQGLSFGGKNCPSAWSLLLLFFCGNFSLNKGKTCFASLAFKM